MNSEGKICSVKPGMALKVDCLSVWHFIYHSSAFEQIWLSLCTKSYVCITFSIWDSHWWGCPVVWMDVWEWTCSRIRSWQSCTGPRIVCQRSCYWDLIGGTLPLIIGLQFSTTWLLDPQTTLVQLNQVWTEPCPSLLTIRWIFVCPV